MQQYKSRNTSVNKSKPPILFTKVDKYFGWKKGTVVYDIGCGKYPEVIETFLKSKGIIYIPTDPYNRTEAENLKVLKRFHRYGPAHVVTISNVLNVIKEKQERLQLINDAWRILRPGGVCYITCYNSGKPGISTPGSYQLAKPLTSYMSLVKSKFKSAEIKYGMITATK